MSFLFQTVNLNSIFRIRIGDKVYSTDQIKDKIEKIEDLEKRIIQLENIIQKHNGNIQTSYN